MTPETNIQKYIGFREAVKLHYVPNITSSNPCMGGLGVETHNSFTGHRTQGELTWEFVQCCW